MLPVAGRPFLEHIVRHLHAEGIRRVVFLTGHFAEQVKDYFGSGLHFGMAFEFVREESPLGTGGAVALAIERGVVSDDFLLLNGDSFLPFSVERLIAAGEQVDGSLVALRVPDGSRYGNLVDSPDGILVGFAEKCSHGSGLINGGAYFLRDHLFGNVPSGQDFSLEREMFPAWLGQGKRFRVDREEGSFLDIGTPESLAQAESFIRQQAQTGCRE